MEIIVIVCAIFDHYEGHLQIMQIKIYIRVRDLLQQFVIVKKY